MKKNKPDEKQFDQLRTSAEQAYLHNDTTLKKMSQREIGTLVHELQIHQIELEMQNEELRRIQVELEESRTKYSDLYDFAPLGYIILDNNGIILEINLTAAAMLGFERSKIINKPLQFFIAKGFLDKFFTHNKKVFETASRQICDLKLAEEQGKDTFVQLQSDPVKGLSGNVVCCRTAIMDITELKKNEKELRETVEAFRTLAENSPDAIVRVDRQTRHLYINSAAARLFKMSPDEIKGKTLEELGVPQPYAGLWRQRVRDVCASGQPFEIEDDFPTVQAGIRTMHSRVVPELAPDGSVVSVLILSRDITERRKNEQSLRKIADEFAHINQEMEQFVYFVSHDLQEPLRMIKGYLELIERRYKGRLDADIDDFIGFAHDGALKMQQLLDGLLEYSRVNRMGKPLEPVDSNTVLEHVLKNLRHSIEDTAAEITHTPLPAVMADSIQLAQVFQNIIGNAIKFRGPQPPRVHIAAILQDSHWRFSITDNGIGIEQKDIDRVFTIFQRLQSKEKYPGSGIGLAVCKKIIERHGGRIWAESVPNKGTTFYFTLPYRKSVLDVSAMPQKETVPMNC